ncbi:ABC transporter permease [Devosia nitrariae]|uniref:Binding-protein-dependent transport permease n=1 Tax=Devosia nitrariae TaxID=2071872 RepID=A0ABQ5VZQ4_9HYPH|nr:ABC transporter permease [Devosia nitrariae]GLQ52900.1 binding-protein-dependent transport permease [Devosia nitrariae]
MSEMISEPPIGRLEGFRAVFGGYPAAIAGLFGIVFFSLIALLAPVLAPQNPFDQSRLDIMDGLLPPVSTLMDGTISVLGTDAVGRDILSAVMYGMRTSLFVALVAVSAGVAVGVVLGLVAVMRGGWIDAVIMRAVDLTLSFPGVLLALLLLVVFGSGADKVILALAIGIWAQNARLVRAVGLSEMKKDYIAAARLAGIGQLRIMFHFLLPNAISPVLVITPMAISGAIVAEATLSFLGVGVPITEPSLGLLIANGNDYLLSGRWWISVAPGLVLVMMVLSINVVADRLRDHANPYLQVKA